MASWWCAARAALSAGWPLLAATTPLSRTAASSCETIAACYGGVRSVVPARRQRFHALHRRPGIVGDDRDQLALVHDLPHAAHGERRIARERFGDAAAFDRRERDQRHLRERRPGVDAELRAAVDLRGRVAPRGGAADEAEVLRGLERRWWRLRQRRGRRRELSVGQPPAGGGVQH